MLKEVEITYYPIGNLQTYDGKSVCHHAHCRQFGLSIGGCDFGITGEVTAYYTSDGTDDIKYEVTHDESDTLLTDIWVNNLVLKDTQGNELNENEVTNVLYRTEWPDESQFVPSLLNGENWTEIWVIDHVNGNIFLK